ncbi:MAG: putative Histidine kinase [Promethearchaeota archaeon]|nr:MAG: putative Histidine kinase [Candidatus Lokiarchaeota archaeon]
MLWFNGLTALGFVSFGTLFEMSLFTKAHRIDAKTLKFMGLNILFATWCYSGYMIDFFYLNIFGENVNNINGWIGIISGSWLAIALVFAMYVSSELLFPKYKNIFTVVYIFIGIVYEFFLIFDTFSSLGFTTPPNGQELINFYVNFYSPLGFIVILYYISLFIFMGLGFLYRGTKSKGIIRKKFVLLGIAELIFLPTSILELMPISTSYFLISRPVLIIVPILIYLAFKEETDIKKNYMKVEQKLFRLTETPFEDFKSTFLRRASHELKTPLIPIKGHLDFLLNEYSENLEEKVENSLKEIKHGYNKLESVIQNFLLSLELEGENLDLNKQEADLSKLIKKCIVDLKDIIDLREHRIILDLKEGLIISFDKIRIYQVINNLLVNSIKYTPTEGKIKISAKKNHSNIKISIKDNGIGIDKMEKKNLFQKFGKIERYGQGWDIISEGSGLGLFICKKIIQAHNGNIWVESEGKNKGTEFIFTLPYSD